MPSIRTTIKTISYSFALLFSTLFYSCKEQNADLFNGIFFTGTTTTTTTKLPTITTTEASSITLTTATCGGNITSDGGKPVTARGVCWSNTSASPNTANSKTSNGIGTGTFTSLITGLTANTKYYARAYATNSVGTAYGIEVSFTTLSGETVTDVDGNVYNAVTIGSQTWMKENLRTTKYRDGSTIANVTNNTFWITLTSGVYCWYNNDVMTYKNTYGALYNYYTVVDSRKLCPTGWHVPTDAEWATLTIYLGGESVAGGKLKEVGVTHWVTPNTGADNSSGFTALPGGYRWGIDGTFVHLGTYGDWWTATEFDADSALDFGISYNNSAVYSYNCSKRDGYSIRCLKGEAQGLTIGQSYQGGIIAYILQSGDPGYSSTTPHGLIAAPYDQSTGIVWWNGSYITTGATAIALGTGNANTNTIVDFQGLGSYAAILCYDLVLNGYSDWYLPSLDELNSLYSNKATIGGFSPNYYWSSTEWGSNYAAAVSFSYGYLDYMGKSATYYVRAVRAF